MNYPTLPAPPLDVSQWINTDGPITLQGLRGKVVVIYVFQMLCPGCVSHGLPQVKAIRRNFSETDVAVLGLHSVFEHHDVMTPKALEAFIHEYQLTFPIGIDSPAKDGAVPNTMRKYLLNGTPSLLLLDRNGRLRANYFGQVDDMRVGALIAHLAAEPFAKASRPALSKAKGARPAKTACEDGTCAMPQALAG